MHPPRSISCNTSTHFRVRAVNLNELTARDRQAWLDLESRAAEPNAYLSPHFVLPAARYLSPTEQPLLLLTERMAAGQRDLVGAAVLQRSRGSRLFPGSHWATYRSRHSFLSGLLLDRSCAQESLLALLDHMRREPGYNGIELPQIWGDGPLAQAISEGAVRSASLHHDSEPEQRAVLRPADAGLPLLQTALSKRMKDLTRRMRRLGERGEVGWRYQREGGISDSTVEAFLALEHAGWKGEHGSSLRSNPADEAFFKQMIAGFGSEGRALFLELTLDGVAIASISNIISGGVGFGFKIGWEPAFKAYSPGLLNEVEFIRHAPEAFSDISYFDSGSNAESYINTLWPSRRPLTAATLPTAPLARLLTDSASSARQLKRRWKTSRLHSATYHAAKPEWMTLASDSLSSFAWMF
ncbi:MAG: GNAT family N-acetyltransferase [Rhizobacter sp.]